MLVIVSDPSMWVGNAQNASCMRHLRTHFFHTDSPKLVPLQVDDDDLTLPALNAVQKHQTDELDQDSDETDVKQQQQQQFRREE